MKRSSMEQEEKRENEDEDTIYYITLRLNETE